MMQLTFDLTTLAPKTTMNTLSSKVISMLGMLKNPLLDMSKYSEIRNKLLYIDTSMLDEHIKQRLFREL